MVVFPNLDQTLPHQIQINRTNPAQYKIKLVWLHASVKKLNNSLDQNSFVVKSIALHKTCSANCPILIRTD
ncbi:hypothetical protein CEV32_2087 [Brucella rhizosphaerae]|uniref:Uncharacterized protein n=1 Tax=Brucella rhizosphaerae TaxID=571254 RepID=A0A256F4M3_9HYPH|nr:hypothetical protein CEV32_2087 [Brucella rhizosphaerae]